MAKVTYGDQGAFVGNPYPGALDLEINDNRTKGVYTDNETNGKISFFGEKLKVSGEDDNYFTSGDIDKIVLKDGEDNMLVTFKGDYKAAQLSTAFQDGGVYGLTRHRKLNGHEAVVARLHHGGSCPSDFRPQVHCL